MTSEIAESFMGTCSLMIEYYRALKKNVIHNGLHKSNKKLEMFIKRLEKACPLIKQTGKGISKKDKKKVEKVIAKQMKKPEDAKRVLGSQIVFEEAEIDEGNKSKDIANMYALISKALKAISGSKKQTEIIKQLNDVRKKLGQIRS